ncbi:MAG TPA: UDP-3-O-(3-hydroxymyristoyl)glucosamine N-acyltransferase [Pseudobdellovibrionaceae bacterium]|nr:UDP-3-O-(3-hydroxymyristoyl)glucosamine N-acyltransferase [Pseudobdellovibrionaceae bacterium]
MIKSEVIVQKFKDVINFEGGDLNAVASEVSLPAKSNLNSLVFVSNIEDLKKVLECGFSILVCESQIYETVKADKKTFEEIKKNKDQALFKTSSISLAMSLLLPLFDGKINRFSQTEKIHPLSFVHPSAHLGAHVIVGPFCFVGEGATIGDQSTLGANVVVESYATIGKQTLLHPQVFIGSHCSVGSHCEIHPHTTIGSDGYGYATDAKGNILKIPQLGRVVIEDHVEIGSGCAIDRATLSETKIGRGTKIDNLCHIAHNCEIGENCFITAGFFVAGSSQIGNRFMTGGNSVVTDHVRIAENVTLAGRSTVTKDITESGSYGGYPLQKVKDYLRTLVGISQIHDLKKDISTVKKHLNID